MVAVASSPLAPIISQQCRLVATAFAHQVIINAARSIELNFHTQSIQTWFARPIVLVALHHCLHVPMVNKPYRLVLAPELARTVSGRS